MAGPFEISDDMLAAAEAAASDFANMGEAYAEEAELEAQKILEFCHAARTAETDAELQNAFQGIFTISHNLKGQGDTFGYQLATRIAENLCELVRPVNSPTRHDVPRACLLAGALHKVLHDRMEGNGGVPGATLCARLEIA